MVDGTRLSQLQEGLTNLNKATDSQFQTVETEMLTLKRQSDAIMQQLTTMNVELQKLSHNSGHSESSIHHHHHRREEHQEPGGEIIPRSVRIDFPSFRGEDPTSWLYKANHFFNFYNTLPQHKLRLASFHMEGQALIWFQDLEESGGLDNWEGFTQALLTRFGPSSYDDPIELLTRLKQVGTVEEYKSKFEALSNRLGGLSESYKLSCFLSGLRDDIRLSVKMFKPEKLLTAYGLARIQEELFGAIRKNSKGLLPLPEPTNQKYPYHSPSTAPKGPPKALVPVQKINQTQMKDRRDKGLCYYCDSKWNPNHKCSNPKLFLIEETQEESGEEMGEEEPLESPTTETQPEISLHALLGSQNPKTMRLRGRVGDQEVVILVDSGSTHNFLDPLVVKKGNLAIKGEESVNVKVANGELLTSEGRCPELRFRVQGNSFSTEVQVLQEGKAIKLKGLCPTNKIEFGGLNKNHKLEKRGLLLQLLENVSVSRKGGVLEQIQNLLNQFDDVFGEPQGLPPNRTQDHAITLLPNTTPVSVRPYRYHYFQKEEIEKIIKELLSNGVIQPSQSPYSSPVLLVRKADGSWRMCVDYRALNKATVKDKFPIPIVEELLDELCGAQIFSKLDLRSGYHQIRFVWSAEAKEAFIKLKTAVTKPPVLALPDFTLPFVIECDASGKAIRAVLMQRNRPIAYFSQALKGRILVWSTYEKELYALVAAIQKWRPYLMGQIFTVKTDHQSLKFLLEQKIGTPMQQKWVSKLLGYDIKVEHKKGTENRVDDALSRRDEGIKQDLEVSISALSIPTAEWWEEIKEGYPKDPFTQNLLSLDQKKQLPVNFTAREGLLYYKQRLCVANHGDSRLKILQ
ncbi:hypothetical protein F2P56_010790, partial [Juglans regia]